MNRYLMIRRLRGPAFLLLLGVCALLHQLNMLSVWRAWPLFLILWGVMLLAERAALHEADMPPYPPPGYPVAPPAAGGGPVPATETGIVPVHGDEITHRFSGEGSNGGAKDGGKQ